MTNGLHYHEEEATISVFEVVGSGLCVSSTDGQKVYERIAICLYEGRGVLLSFRNISALTPAFLNSAIGQLLGEFSEAQIRASITVKDIEPEDLALLRRVVQTAKQYFKERKGSPAWHSN